MKERAAASRAAAPAQPSDEEIVARVRAGETRWFEELVRRYQDRVYGMAWRCAGREAEAQDIAQEAFLRVHRGLEGFKGDARFSTWLYRITFNLCADWSRRRRSPVRATTGLEQAAEVVDHRESVEQRVLESDDRRQLREALDALDEKYRVVIQLHYYEGLSYDQIAEVTGMPAKTVETRLYRARHALRGRLAEPLKGESR